MIALASSRFSTKKVILLVVASFLACTAESFFLKAENIGVAYGQYVFLVPLSFAVFCWSKDAALGPAYAKLCTTLRKLSMMIYFVHPWFLFLLNAASHKLVPLDSLERFLLAVILSVATAALWLRFRPRYAVLRELG